MQFKMVLSYHKYFLITTYVQVLCLTYWEIQTLIQLIVIELLVYVRYLCKYLGRIVIQADRNPCSHRAYNQVGGGETQKSVNYIVFKGG